MTDRTPTTLRRDVVVIGAGQAGLSASHFLRKGGLTPGVDFDVLDANPTAGGAWSHRWDALTLGDAHGIHDLPDFPLGVPDPTEPAREVVKRYYAAYERHENLRVQRPWRVTEVEDSGRGPLLVGATSGDLRREYVADAVISATGTWDRPYVPAYPGRFAGIQLTTRDFRAPEDFRGKRVLVVGGGASAVQFLLLLERYGVSTVWSTRRPPQWIDRAVSPRWGAEVERRVAAKTRAGLPAGSVVSNTGLLKRPDYEAGIARGTLVSRGRIARLTEHGVDFVDGSHADVEVILWATGFRASLGHLAPLKLREPGGGLLVADDDVSLVREPRLFVVGYGPSASTLGATRAGRRAARGALRSLEKPRDLDTLLRFAPPLLGQPGAVA
ncbi:flavin-containing monooxygenase [Flexivirga oryzae]|uniref:Cation diffusion facilitator CzcD-associated flavoprotein CzcO n=1 Tax=Flexivirga oryzae TaxID=1794944 RepID=A0A839NBE3_9MICO|nr:NAD(P)/FAD-dependent oxidoreductase [Flexivirga oryzae]MBB2893294.1 cation diffusion facilitator CzcD-associated flavoprotein CzcO [Flexivirga oryzae]